MDGLENLNYIHKILCPLVEFENFKDPAIAARRYFGTFQ